ncbi:MAG TPA: hypothetical protein DDW42_02150 [Desulfobacteraceae bacterium]|nr:hypothetical protein [Desulfobacteraceae bacterium]
MTLEELRMKRHWQLFVILVFFFSLWGNLSLAQKVQGPKMVLKDEVFDFNEVKEGTIVEHSFKILNVGDQPLEIKVRPG